MIAFHTKFASCLKQSPGVPRFWKHSFESTYIFPNEMTNAEVAATAPAANAKFQQWAEDNNPDIRHWAQRWEEGEFLANFSMITIPHATEHPMSKAKFGEFWRFWLLGVLKHGRYGLSGGLAAGAAPSCIPGLAFKHWKPNNLLGLSDLTLAEVKEAFDLPTNATALGYYVNDPASLAKEPAAFSNYIRKPACEGRGASSLALDYLGNWGEQTQFDGDAAPSVLGNDDDADGGKRGRGGVQLVAVHRMGADSVQAVQGRHTVPAAALRRAQA